MPLDAWIDAHRADPFRATFWLVEIAFAVPQRLTDCDQPIVFDGDTYGPMPLRVDGVASDSSGISSGASVAIGAADDYWPTLLAALAEDERHPEVTIHEAWLDVTTMSPTPAAVRTVGRFRVEAAEITPTEARLTLGPAADPTLGRIPFREYGSGLCTYRVFKGAQCGYAGAATSCDRTYATCTGLSNQARFGGFRSLPGEEVTLTWLWQSGDQVFEETIVLTRREE